MSSHEPRSSSQVGPYALQELLGRGGMGEVYAAVDPRLERRVAVKHVRGAAGADADRRFRREIKTVAGLSHPGIVQVFDVVDEGDGTWVVMELVDGPTLADCLRHGPLDVATTVLYARQIAAGLAAAHRQGVVHRDLKTENVMVTGSGHVKILDFGLAKKVQVGAESSLSTLDDSLTAQGALLGTLRCMSPEQARGFPVDRRTDLFALGVLIYELCAGFSPFQGSTQADTLSRILTYRQKPLDEVRPEIPRPLSDLVDHLLEKAPEQRPPNLDGVLDGLRRLEASLGAHDLTDDETELIDPTSPLLDAHFSGEPASSSSRSPFSASRPLPLVAVLVVLVLSVAALIGLRSRELAPERTRPATGGTATASESLNDMDVPALYRFGMGRLDRSDKKGYLDEAMEAFRRALELDPEHAASHAALARAYVDKHATEHQDDLWLDHASGFADRAVELDEHLASAHAAVGLVAATRSEPEAAQKAFDRALALSPENGEILFFKGRSLFHKRDFDGAEPLLQRALDAGYRHRAVYDTLGFLNYQLGRTKDAVEHFQNAVATAPDSHISLRNLSAAYYSAGDLNEAAKTLQQALEINPSSTLYSNLGTLFFAQGRYSDAAKAYDKALHLEGGGRKARQWANLGDAYRFIPNREADARHAFSQAAAILERRLTEQDRDDWRTHLILARAKLGEPEEVDNLLRRLRDENGLQSRDLYRLAVAEEILGRRDRALVYLERAMLKGFPPHEVETDPELVALRSDPRHVALWNRLPEPSK